MKGVSSPNKWLVTATVMLGTMMNAIDTSIVNVALPYMRGNLGASIEEIAWVSTGFILSNVIIMPIIALLSARFGRRQFYFTSVLLFTVASILCGLARDLDFLIFARLLQGLGGGAITPLSQAILRESFEPEEQGMAMGIFGLGVILGPAFGPTLGGWLTDHYSWPWIFYINIPFGIVNLFMILKYIEDPPYLVREEGKIDWLGLGCMIVGLGALQVMLEKGQEKDWFSSSYILWLAVLASVGIVLFVWRELSIEKPAVDLRLLKNRTFAAGTVIGAVLGMGLYASLFLLPMFLQQLLGYPAYDSGLVIMPRALAMALAMPIGGRLYNVMGPKPLIVVGLSVSAIAFLQMSSFSLDTGFATLFFPQVLQGFGLGLAFVAVSTAALSSIDRVQMTAASGLYNVIRQVSGSIGIALSATFLTRGYVTARAYLMENVSSMNEETATWLSGLQQLMIGKGFDSGTARQQALDILAKVVDQHSYMMSFNHVYIYVCILFILTIPLVLAVRISRF
jgi:DHA2 family multidrug resistance protein